MSYRGNHAKTGKISAMKVCHGEADRAMKADSAEGRRTPGKWFSRCITWEPVRNAASFPTPHPPGHELG